MTEDEILFKDLLLPIYLCLRPMHQEKPDQVLEKIARNLDWQVTACGPAVHDSNLYKLRNIN